MEDEEIVGGCQSHHLVRRVPSNVEDLLVEVEAVDAHLVLLPLAALADPPVPEGLPELEAVSGRLQGRVPLRLSVEDLEETVVRAGHDVP